MSEPQANRIPVSQPGSLITIVPVAMLLGLWAQYLFFQNALGLNVIAMCLAGLAALIFLAWRNRIMPAWQNIWLAGLMILYADMTAWRAAPFSIFLNFSTTLGLCVFFTHLFTSGALHRFKALDYFSVVIASFFEITLLQPSSAAVDWFKNISKQNFISARSAAILRGVLLAVMPILILTMLLTSADIAFNQIVLDIFRFLRVDNLPEISARLVVVLLFAWVCLGGLAYSLRKTERNKPANELAGRSSQGPLGLIESAIILGSVDALFAAFVFVQFRYFFGGQAGLLINGFTYAEYARRGFAELLVVALFSLGLALMLNHLTRRENRWKILGFEGLVLILVSLTVIILASSFLRLRLYEDAYGFTQLRTYTHVLIIWLAVLLVVFVICLHFNRVDLFLFSVFIACLCFVASLDFLNTDAFIARSNFERYTASGKLDAVYLATLSDDAIPFLVSIMDSIQPNDQEIIGSALHERLNEIEQVKTGWQSWNWSTAQAYQLLKEQRLKLENYPPKRFEWSFPLD